MQIEPVAPGVVKAILEGRMDAAGASRIDLQFNAIAGSHRGLIAEMSGVDFLASMGMRTLMLAAKMMQRRGGMLVLLAPPSGRAVRLGGHWGPGYPAGRLHGG